MCIGNHAQTARPIREQCLVDADLGAAEIITAKPGRIERPHVVRLLFRIGSQDIGHQIGVGDIKMRLNNDNDFSHLTCGAQRQSQ